MEKVDINGVYLPIDISVDLISHLISEIHDRGYSYREISNLLNLKIKYNTLKKGDKVKYFKISCGNVFHLKSKKWFPKNSELLCSIIIVLIGILKDSKPKYIRREIYFKE